MDPGRDGLGQLADELVAVLPGGLRGGRARGVEDDGSGVRHDHGRPQPVDVRILEVLGDESPRVVGGDTGVHESGISERSPETDPVEERKPQLVHLRQRRRPFVATSSLSSGRRTLAASAIAVAGLGTWYSMCIIITTSSDASVSGNAWASAATSAGGAGTPASMPTERSMPRTLAPAPRRAST